ncbi:SH2 domain [Trinorchestia longiramus]|nr:SH2 domain [Trinorchestia longiramus]
MSPKCDIFQGNLYDQAYNSTQSPALSELLQNNSCVETVAKVRKDPIGAHCGSLPSSDERVPTKSWSQEFRDFSKQSWYWGPLTRHEAEEKLTDCSDGVFLVRDSSDDRYLLSLSFRSFGKTYHTRIDHSNGLFSFNPPREHKGFATLNELITSCVAQSSSGVLCYSKARNSASPGFPVRLCTPLSRTTQVQPLQHLCCFVILQHTRLDLVPRLPLPPSLTRLLAHKHR